MKEFIFNNSQNFTQELTVEQILMNMSVALILGLLIFISYRFSHSSAVYSAKFNVSLLMMTLVTTMVMNVIGNNISLSLGMVGALSIVRFRTAIKDSRDTAYIFWGIAVGICCGVSYYELAGISSGVIFLVMILMGHVRSNDRFLIIIHADSTAKPSEIEERLLYLFDGKAILRVANSSTEHYEFIYELSERILKSAEKKEKNPLDILTLTGVTNVDIVCQNEELSR